LLIMFLNHTFALEYDAASPCFAANPKTDGLKS